MESEQFEAINFQYMLDQHEELLQQASEIFPNLRVIMRSFNEATTDLNNYYQYAHVINQNPLSISTNSVG